MSTSDGGSRTPGSRSSTSSTARVPDRGRRVGPQGGHRGRDPVQPVAPRDPDRPLAGDVRAVDSEDVVETVEHGAARGSQVGGQLGGHQRGRHPVLVPNELAHAVPKGLLVAEEEPLPLDREPGPPT